jgi:hypothetical protein
MRQIGNYREESGGGPRREVSEVWLGHAKGSSRAFLDGFLAIEPCFDIT